jgi:hypothetical protein
MPVVEQSAGWWGGGQASHGVHVHNMCTTQVHHAGAANHLLQAPPTAWQCGALPPPHTFQQPLPLHLPTTSSPFTAPAAAPSQPLHSPFTAQAAAPSQTQQRHQQPQQRHQQRRQQQHRHQRHTHLASSARTPDLPSGEPALLLLLSPSGRQGVLVPLTVAAAAAAAAMAAAEGDVSLSGETAFVSGLHAAMSSRNEAIMSCCTCCTISSRPWGRTGRGGLAAQVL